MSIAPSSLLESGAIALATIATLFLTRDTKQMTSSLKTARASTKPAGETRTGKKPVGLLTATSLVIANMIGTGVFTSLGFQVLGIHSAFALMLIWIIGGIAATCGALAYGELGAAMPRSGGEYHFLSRIIHPSVGFVSGWVSSTVGFAAPVALAAMALGDYASRVFTGVSQEGIAIGVVIILTIVHSSDVRLGKRFQDVFTSVKVLLILFFIAAGLIIGGVAGHHITVMPDGSAMREILSRDFAVSLFFVSYAYSGWNASAYIAGEIDRPQRTLPRSLLQGTLTVTLLYVLLNYVFLYTTPIAQLAGKVDVGYIAAANIFGANGGKMMALIIALLLVSSVSSMIMAGPRVVQVMGQDVAPLRGLSKTTRKGVPALAIAFQSAITIFLILTSTFERLITYMGFTLNLFTMMTVAGVIVLRRTQPDLPRPSQMWGYPYTAIAFLAIGLWVLVYGLAYKPFESLAGLATVLVGFVVYALAKRTT
jgi:APA family basic amino acid/polyamine antiporter